MSIWDENGNREGRRREESLAPSTKKEAAEATSLQKH